MKITDLLDPRSISLDAAPTSKSETLDKAVELMAASGKLSDVEAFRKQVDAREEESTTGIGEGIAIPHGKCDAVKKPGLAAMVIKNGVDFDSLDGEPVTLLFLIAAPNTKDNVHLDVLSKLSVLMMDENFSDSLRNASSVEDFLSIIDKADAEQAGIDERLAADSVEEAADTNGENAAQAGGQEIQAQKAGAETEKTAGPKILAVTSCPTGIAHTYMAAEGLEKAARAKGWKIKVETRGSAGAKNVLTAQEIEAADCIIVAADAQVPMDRFDGKRVIECQVSDGISKAPELLERAASGEVPVYHAASSGSSSPAKAASGGKSGSVGHQIYTQLMNGVSHMLPFVVGGGILIAIAFLIDGFSPDSGWFHRDGDRRPPGAGSRFCRRHDCFSGKIRFPWRPGGRFYCRISDSGASESVRESSRGTGKDCSGPDLPGCGRPAHRTGYELRRRAGHGRDQYGVKQWSEQHGWFE